jgi:Zn-dependent peptidase ImmA (M78 family)/formiminotetrahydrofolate cyclodeaminase
MMASQLILTVIKLTNDPKRQAKYRDALTKLLPLAASIETRIYPELARWFVEDSVQFGKVIPLRDARDAELNPSKKRELARKANEALKIATDIPLAIAELCIELAKHSKEAFDTGFRSARGDSAVALNGAVSAVGGCISVIHLNLLSLGHDEWTDDLHVKTNELLSQHSNLASIAKECMMVLKNEVDRNKAFELEVKRFRSGMWEGTKLTNSDIELIAKDLQNMLWKYKDKIWKQRSPEFILDILQPDIVLTKILDYQLERVDSLGLDEIDDEEVEVAGMINKTKKLVVVSDQFAPEIQSFTIGHELGHALLHKVVTAHRDRASDGSNVSGKRPISERQADRFSTYFLMPEKQIRKFFKERFGVDQLVLNDDTAFALNQGRVSELRTEWKKNEIKFGLARALSSIEQYKGQSFYSMATIFRVSEQAMAIRLIELRIAFE